MSNKAYLYGRVSTAAQDLGIDVQEEQARGYYAYKLKPQGLGLVETFHADAAVSGDTPFRDRPSGARLNLALDRGDHLIVAKLDRAFRNVMDMFNCLHAWQERGVVVHFLDANIDTSSIVGRLVVGILGVIAEFERARICERIRDNKRMRKARGLPVSGPAPLGRRISGVKGHRYFVDDEYELACMERIFVLRNAGLTWHAIYRKFYQAEIRTRRDKEWSVDRIERGYAAFCLRLSKGESQPPPELAGRPLPPLPPPPPKSRGTSPSSRTPANGTPPTSTTTP